MTINLEEFVDKNVVVTFRNGETKIGHITKKTWGKPRFYIFNGLGYYCSDGKVFYNKEYKLDIIDIKLAIDIAMNSIPPEWKSRWCTNHMCACMGCANKSGGLTAKGYTYQDWLNWISKNKEKYMNSLSPVKEIKWNNATEKMRTNKLVNKLQNNTWRVEVQDSNYPKLNVIDETTVIVDGVKYKKAEEKETPTLYEFLIQCEYGEFNPSYVEIDKKLQIENSTENLVNYLYENCDIVEEDENKLVVKINKKYLEIPNEPNQN